MPTSRATPTLIALNSSVFANKAIPFKDPEILSGIKMIFIVIHVI